jgi:hypothetical protein
MDFAASRSGVVLGFALVALSLALLTPAAEAASLSSARAVTPEPAVATTSAPEVSPAPEAMSLEFLSKTAKVAGPGALVEVRCVGTTGSGCVGTVAIEAPGEPPEVAYSIERGERRTLVVPLGEQRGIFDGLVSVKSRVVAQTVQFEGGSVRTARTLRFK